MFKPAPVLIVLLVKLRHVLISSKWKLALLWREYSLEINQQTYVYISEPSIQL